MAHRNDCDVLVVGAGPVGLAAALALTQKGLSVQIVDESWRTAGRSYALALHGSTLRALEKLGSIEPLLSQGQQVTTMELFDGQMPAGSLNLARADDEFPFVLVLPQQALEDALQRQLAGQKVRVQWNDRVSALDLTASGCSGTIEHLEKYSGGYSVARTEWLVQSTRAIRCGYVLGCDGHRSVVRRALGLEFVEQGRPVLYAVFELSAPEVHIDTIRVVFDAQGPSVLWPLGQDHYRWSFALDDRLSLDLERAKSRLAVQADGEILPHLDRPRLLQLIAERAPWFSDRIRELEWSVLVRFERRLTTAAGKERAFLAGDAAHLSAPIGVQSMNVGIQEAVDISERICCVVREGAPASLLDDYAQNQPAAWRKQWQTAVEPGPKAAAWVTKYAEQICGVLPATGPGLDKLLGELGLRRSDA